MVEVLELCKRYAHSSYPILILGPAGSGKTVLARHIHGLSGRSGDFVNCSVVGIPENLEHSYLAGHAAGAFTGAKSQQKGLIEAAHLGTLFLDELGLASPNLQCLLLQFLDQGTLRRLGDTRVLPVTVRLVAATNADLSDMCEKGLFRRDLLGRFGYLHIELPPLTDRRDEILPLVDHYLEYESRVTGRCSTPILTAAVRECLHVAPWRDNIREIRAVCQYIALNSTEDAAVEIYDLPPAFIRRLGDLASLRAERSLADRAREALRMTGGNKTRAARILGVSRRHIYRLLETPPGA